MLFCFVLVGGRGNKTHNAASSTSAPRYYNLLSGLVRVDSEEEGRCANACEFYFITRRAFTIVFVPFFCFLAFHHVNLPMYLISSSLVRSIYTRRTGRA